MVNNTEFHFVECQSINVQEITELESHFLTPNETTYLSSGHKWLLKP